MTVTKQIAPRFERQLRTTAEPLTLNGTGGNVGGDGALRTNATGNPTFTGQIALRTQVGI